MLFAATLLSHVSLPAHSQTQNKNSVFSKLPTTQQPTAQQKRQLGSARTYGEKQRIKKQLAGATQPAPKQAISLGLDKKTQQRAGATRKTGGRAFGPRQRIRAQSKQRGGLTAQGGQPTTK